MRQPNPAGGAGPAGRGVTQTRQWRRGYGSAAARRHRPHRRSERAHWLSALSAVSVAGRPVRRRQQGSAAPLRGATWGRARADWPRQRGGFWLWESRAGGGDRVRVRPRAPRWPGGAGPRAPPLLRGPGGAGGRREGARGRPGAGGETGAGVSAGRGPSERWDERTARLSLRSAEAGAGGYTARRRVTLLRQGGRGECSSRRVPKFGSLLDGKCGLSPGALLLLFFFT